MTLITRVVWFLCVLIKNCLARICWFWFLLETMKLNIVQDEFHKIVLGLNSIKLSCTHTWAGRVIFITLWALATFVVFVSIKLTIFLPRSISYFKNYWTNTRLVCTHLKAYFHSGSKYSNEYLNIDNFLGKYDFDLMSAV